MREGYRALINDVKYSKPAEREEISRTFIRP
jgi:hypothetical protein